MTEDTGLTHFSEVKEDREKRGLHMGTQKGSFQSK